MPGKNAAASFSTSCWINSCRTESALDVGGLIVLGERVADEQGVIDVLEKVFRLEVFSEIILCQASLISVN